MRNLLLLGAVAAVLAGTSPVVAQTAKHSTKKGSHHRKPKRGAWKRKGQQVIQPERTQEIQEALIREKYLDGTPTGKWDARTQSAMSRYQTDHGWQSKVTPDSRALIKLGLGPNYEQHSASLGSNAFPGSPSSSHGSSAAQDKR